MRDIVRDVHICIHIYIYIYIIYIYIYTYTYIYSQHDCRALVYEDMCDIMSLVYEDRVPTGCEDVSHMSSRHVTHVFKTCLHARHTQETCVTSLLCIKTMSRAYKTYTRDIKTCLHTRHTQETQEQCVTSSCSCVSRRRHV